MKRTTKMLPTGLTDIDNVLGGGFENGSVVEINGGPKSGKSQWCHHLAVANLRTEGTVLWLDSESSFTPTIVRANALRHGLNQDSVLSSIMVRKIVNFVALEDNIDDLEQNVSKHDASLVIIDSLGLFQKYQPELLPMVFDTLRRVALVNDCVVVYTVWWNILHDHLNPTHRLFARYIGPHKREIVLENGTEVTLDIHLGWGGFYEELEHKERFESSVMDEIGVSVFRKQDEVIKE